MRLKQVPGEFGIAQLPQNAAIPPWVDGPGFWAISRADDEMTVICAEDRIPQAVTAEKGWHCFRSLGPFAFDETGVVAGLVGPLSVAGIGVFVVCTFDGEHILCPARDFDRAKAILTREGHQFEPD